MYKMYHLSLAGGKTETQTVEAKSYSNLLNFCDKTSESIVRNIKEVEYSKKYNINYASSPYVDEPVYKKVLVTALTENHRKTFTLFHIKRTVSKSQLINYFKKLYIKNEPIIDFSDILFFEEGDLSPIDILNLYQIQYKRNNKTYVEDFYAKTYIDLLDVCKNLIGGEITEIRKYLHSNSKVITKTLENVHNFINIYISNETSYRSFKIPNVKTSLSQDTLLNHIKETFSLVGKSIETSNITLNYR